MCPASCVLVVILSALSTLCGDFDELHPMYSGYFSFRIRLPDGRKLIQIKETALDASRAQIPLLDRDTTVFLRWVSDWQSSSYFGSQYLI